MYLGNRNEEVNPLFLATTEKAAWKFTVGASGLTPTFAFAFGVAIAAAPPSVTIALYTDNAGAPDALVPNGDALLAFVIAVPFPATGVWHGAKFATPPVLAANTDYWICIQTESAPGDAILLNTAAGAANQQADPLADPLPLSDPYGAPPSYSNNTASIFVEDDAGAITGGRVVIPDNTIRL